METVNAKSTFTKEYVSFLRRNCLDTLARQRIQYSKEVNLSFRFYENLSEDDLFELFKKQFDNLLQLFEDNNSFESLRKILEKWRRNELDISQEEVKVSDIILYYKICKQAMFAHIPLYTTDVKQGIQLVTELEDYYTTFNLEALDTYQQIQKDLLQEQEAIVKNEKFLKHVTNFVPSLITVYSVNTGKYIYVNDGAENIVGFSSENILEGGVAFIASIVHPDDVDKLMQQNMEAIEAANADTKGINDDKAVSFEYRIRNSKDEWLWVHTYGMIFERAKDGKVEKILNVSVDITERKKIETKLLHSQEELQSLNNVLEEKIKEATKELLLSEEKFKEAQRISHLGSWDFDLLTGKIYWSEEHFLIHGMDPSKGEPDYEVMMSHFPEAELLQKKVNKAIAEGVPYDFDTPIIWDDGTRKFIQAIGKPIMEDGKCIKLYGTAIDITERKQTEDALKKNREQLKLITDALPGLVCYIDQEQRYRFINETYVKWYGSKAKEFVGKTLRETLGEKSYNSLQTYIEAALAGQEVSYELQMPSEHCESKYISGKYVPDIDEQGKVKGYIALIMDITESVKSKIELKNKNEELIRTNNDLDNFIYTASHDLKAPINNLEGLINTYFKEVPPQEEFNDMVGMMHISIDRFKQTINDLTEITKVQKGQTDDFETISMKELLEESVFSIQTLITASKATLESDFEVEQIKFSRKNLRSILYNLVSNGIKYASPYRKPIIKINTRRLNDYILLSVTDNGLGVNEENKSKIFGMFKRLHDHVEGSGVGLYIVKRIVDNSGGRIEVESEIGKGSTFNIYLKAF